jgi:hypothetical protein
LANYNGFNTTEKMFMFPKRWLLIFTVLVVGTVGVFLAQGGNGETAVGSSTPTLDAAGLDPNYDDSWTKNVPDTINGFQVLFVTTPKNQACSYIPIVHLKTAHDSIKQYLDKVDGGPILNAIRAIEGVPPDVTVSFSGPSASAEMIRSNTERWNATKAALGCDEAWGPKPELVQP